MSQLALGSPRAARSYSGHRLRRPCQAVESKPITLVIAIGLQFAAKLAWAHGTGNELNRRS